ncbi:hypothetical protein SERLA73DRAFT_189277 [Serpula lacrymans var. lacrymans S7.3]|uniref:DUF6534 domain-containing protein n=1 Tax=Serpula lacrymans var. lacrymans (strain S7.3) TaxID=936435 RepID=F8QDA3_SERL3|nr:hypothetical protein SERLA73DRAFT_189277 [Serpula lacrymans var. lacrymans S7.3]
MDTAHTSLIWGSIWTYLITNFGDTSKIDTIPRTVAMSIALTAILTFIVHCFFAHRIHKLSRGDWRITIPLSTCAFLRLCSASVTTGEMIHMETFSSFKHEFRWVFTLGLALSSLVDVLIAVFLCHSLRGSRKASSNSSMDHVINSVILYTFENGSITCTATIVSMVCWLAMPNNLVFMGLHFVIGKLYANSLLATLNARKQLQRERSQRGLSGELPIVIPGFANRFRSRQTSTEALTHPNHVRRDLHLPLSMTLSRGPKSSCHQIFSRSLANIALYISTTILVTGQMSSAASGFFWSYHIYRKVDVMGQDDSMDAGVLLRVAARVLPVVDCAISLLDR